MILKHIGLQIHITKYGKSMPKLVEVIGKCTGKPHGGLWTSTFNKNNIYKSEWHEYIIRSQVNWLGSAWLVYPEPKLKIFDVASTDDINDLVYNGYAIYDKNASFEREYLIDPYTHFNMRYIIDWERLAEEYDAFHVPSYMAIRYMKDWDVESTVWFKPKFRIVRYDKKL
jgi:hypothetical protein